jgi:hypothetical protein
MLMLVSAIQCPPDPQMTVRVDCSELQGERIAHLATGFFSKLRPLGLKGIAGSAAASAIARLGLERAATICH